VASKVPSTRGVTPWPYLCTSRHPALKPTPQPGQGRGTVLRELLARDTACREIVQYLMRHSEAADTARGIADWWIRRDVASTLKALLKLRECGVVQSYAVQDNTFVYAYTKNAVLRQALARYLQGRMLPHPAKGL